MKLMAMTVTYDDQTEDVRVDLTPALAGEDSNTRFQVLRAISYQVGHLYDAAEEEQRERLARQSAEWQRLARFKAPAVRAWGERED